MMYTRKQQAFTIVELLIVVVIIAILATITVVAYSGIQSRARNTARSQELVQWQKLFLLYKAANGQYPTMVENQEYCLGSGYPIGYGGVARCHSFGNSTSPVESDNSSLMTALKTVGSIPSGDRMPLGGLVGPYVSQSAGILTLTMTQEGTDCPSGFSKYWDDGSSRATCAIRAY